MSTSPSPRNGRVRRLFVALISAALMVGLVGEGVAAQAPAAPKPTPKKVRIAYFANVTHAAALVGVQRKTFEKYFQADNTTVEYTIFNAGPAEVEAMKGGAIDIGYIGPNPAIAGYASTNGSLLRIIAGATHNGAQLVVNKSINSIADLKGKTVATPQLGNTQDVAARTYFAKQGYSTTITGGGDIKIAPTENATSLTLFKSGRIDGAWVPEPWASRLVLEGNGKVLLDEKDLWKNNQFLTTNVIVSKKFLDRYPKSVETFLKAHIDVTNFISQPKNAQRTKDLIQAELLARTGKTLTQETIDRAWSNLKPNFDPLAKALLLSANDASSAGLLNLPAKGLTKIYDLRILNRLLLQANPKFKKFSTSGLGLG